MRLSNCLHVLVLLLTTFFITQCGSLTGKSLLTVKYDIPVFSNEVNKQHVPQLITALHDRNPGVVLFSARTLAYLGSEARSSLPTLAEVAKHHWHTDAKLAAMRALPKVGKDDPIMLNALAYIIQYGEPNKIRVEAAKEFRYMGLSAAPAVPVLIKKLDSKNYRIRHNVVLTLRNIGFMAIDAVPALERLVKTENKTLILHEAQEAIRQITYKERYEKFSTMVGSQIDEETENRLLELAEIALNDPDIDERVAALKEMTRLDREHPVIIKTLSELLENGRPIGIRFAAARGLIFIGPSAAPALPVLMRSLKSESSIIRAYSVRALGNMGSIALEAVPLLQQVAEEEKRVRFRNNILEAIRKITFEESHQIKGVVNN